MLFDYYHSSHGERVQHHVFYRPALLSGRHIVDVLRAICGPADVSEAELDRVRKNATKEAIDMSWRMGSEGWEGVWKTMWYGAPVTAK